LALEDTHFAAEKGAASSIKPRFPATQRLGALFTVIMSRQLLPNKNLQTDELRSLLKFKAVSSTMTSRTPPDVEQLLSAEEMKLTLLTRRLFALEAFLAELERLTRGKPFRIWNSVTWMMLLDTRDAFVIHLASWARGMYKTGGLLRQLQAHGLRALRKKRQDSGALEDRVELRRYIEASRDEAFGRLFPEVDRPYATTADVEALRERFIDKVDELTADRDGNRAHPYEAGTQRKMMDLVALREAVTQAESLLADLRLVCCGSSFSFHDMNATSVDIAAAELVDAILLPPRARARGRWNSTERDEYYDQLHRSHAQTRRKYFNAPNAEETAVPDRE
jgi:hypothetical protein